MGENVGDAVSYNVTTHNSLHRVVTGDATYLSGFKNGFAIKRVRS
jgi:hypothetical protein